MHYCIEVCDKLLQRVSNTCWAALTLLCLSPRVTSDADGCLASTCVKLYITTLMSSFTASVSSDLFKVPKKGSSAFETEVRGNATILASPFSELTASFEWLAIAVNHCVGSRTAFADSVPFSMLAASLRYLYSALNTSTRKVVSHSFSFSLSTSCRSCTETRVRTLSICHLAKVLNQSREHASFDLLRDE